MQIMSVVLRHPKALGTHTGTKARTVFCWGKTRLLMPFRCRHGLLDDYLSFSMMTPPSRKRT